MVDDKILWNLLGTGSGRLLKLIYEEGIRDGFKNSEPNERIGDTAPRIKATGPKRVSYCGSNNGLKIYKVEWTYDV